jgi:hypothetical protein
MGENAAGTGMMNALWLVKPGTIDCKPAEISNGDISAFIRHHSLDVASILRRSG